MTSHQGSHLPHRPRSAPEQGVAMARRFLLLMMLATLTPAAGVRPVSAVKRPPGPLNLQPGIAPPLARNVDALNAFLVGQSKPLTRNVAQSATVLRTASVGSLPASQRAVTVSGLRDPFKLPEPPVPQRPETEHKPAVSRPPGKGGLVIDELRLEGVVRIEPTRTMIAVVTNATNRAYFLREGDALYNGVVSKITRDAAYFRESIRDAKGQLGSREVVKRLGPAPGGPT